MNLFKSAITVSGLTFVSRITGLIRDILIGSIFGASALTDAFWVAFRLPNLLRRLFAEGAFAQAFVPILGEVKHQQGERDAKQLVDNVASVLVVCLLFVSMIGVLAAPFFLYLIGSGLHTNSANGHWDHAVWMTRIMFPYIFCMSLVALASGVLNTWKKFAIPAATPILLNISMIISTIALTPWIEPSIYALAIGVMGGGLMQLGMQVYALRRIGMLPKLTWNIRSALSHRLVRRVLGKMAPAVLGVSVAQISLLINTNIATQLVAGSVSWLSFADRLMEFPTALLGVALGAVLLPSLSKAHAAQETQTYSRLLDWGLRLTVLLGLPAAIGLGLMAEALVSVLFHYGAFSDHDVTQTRYAVWAYAIGLLGMLAIKILAPGFYAQQNIKTPVKIAIVILLLTQALNLVFVPYFSHVGLALSIALGSCCNALALLYGLIKRKTYQLSHGWLSFIVKVCVAVMLMSFVLVISNRYVNWLELGASPFLRIVYVGATLLLAALIYFTSLRILGVNLKALRRAPVDVT